jgi:hypothetical protein
MAELHVMGADVISVVPVPERERSAQDFAEATSADR